MIEDTIELGHRLEVVVIFYPASDNLVGEYVKVNGKTHVIEAVLTHTGEAAVVAYIPYD